MKTTEKGRRLRTPEEKQALIKEWETSGQSAMAFCEGKGIETSQLYRWRLVETGQHSTKRTDEEKRQILAEGEKRGLSILQLSKETGIANSILYRWRQRIRAPSHKRRFRLKPLRAFAAPIAVAISWKN